MDAKFGLKTELGKSAAPRSPNAADVAEMTPWPSMSRNATTLVEREPVTIVLFGQGMAAGH